MGNKRWIIILRYVIVIIVTIIELWLLTIKAY